MIHSPYRIPAGAGSLRDQTGETHLHQCLQFQGQLAQGVQYQLMTGRENTLDVDLIKNTPSSNYLRYLGKLTEWK